MDVYNAHQSYRESVDSRIQNIIRENRSWENKYPALMNLLEGSDRKKQETAKATLLAMENQARFMENLSKDARYEATFTQALGQLVPRVIDVVRIFYPNLIANHLVDIQTLDRQNGEIFFVNPIFTDTAAGVTAGDQIFSNVTDGTYSSENMTQALDTGDGSTVNFTGTLAPNPVRINSVTITATVGAATVTATDDGAGNLTGTGIDAASTVNYTTGAFDITFDTAPDNATAISATFRWNSEETPDTIREVELQLGVLPVTAEPHPLRVNWSTQAELAASSHLDLDIGDILSNLVASLIKNERDILLANQIIASSTAEATLNFDAAPPTNYSRLAKYAEIECKLDEAESIIQASQGRGGVSWVMGGNNAVNVWRHATGFVPSDVVAPIGPHVVGTLRDGTVTVVKVPTMATNRYVVGFKGYVTGDAATILAEWIPLYASPTFRSYDLTNYQGMMSLYALVQNNVAYYRHGDISNYAA